MGGHWRIHWGDGFRRERGPQSHARSAPSPRHHACFRAYRGVIHRPETLVDAYGARDESHLRGCPYCRPSFWHEGRGHARITQTDRCEATYFPESLASSLRQSLPRDAQHTVISFPYRANGCERSEGGDGWDLPGWEVLCIPVAQIQRWDSGSVPTRGLFELAHAPPQHDQHYAPTQEQTGNNVGQ